MSFLVEICVEGGLKVSPFIYDKSIYIIPGVLSDSACALRRMIGEKVACWYSRLVATGLLNLYFVCNIF